MAGPSIDSSIYFHQETPDFLGNVQRGMSMRDMMDNRALKQKQIAEDDAIKAAYREGIKKNPDGTTSFDSAKTASAIMGVNPQKGLEFQQQQVAQDAAARKAHYEKVTQTTDFLGRASSTMKQSGGQGYDQLLAQAKATGMDTSMMPPVYGPDAQQKLDYYYGQALTVKDQMAQADKDRDYGLREKELQGRSADRAESRAERGAKKAEQIQGLKTPYGLANTEDDAKRLKEAHESKQNFDNKIDQMIALREKSNGGETWNREAVARGKQLSKDALLEYKNMAKLGVLSQSDEAIINAIIPEDPLQYNSPVASIQGQDPTLARLKAFKADNDKDFRSKVSTRTRAGVETAAQHPSPKKAIVDRQVNKTTGQVRNVYSDGTFEVISSKVAGGQ